MLELNFIREQKVKVLKGLKTRNADEAVMETVDEILTLDDTRKSVQTELDDANAKRNQLSKEIGDLFKSGKKDLANEKKALVNDLKNIIGGLEEKLKETKDTLEQSLYTLPNVPHESVPSGNTDDDNEVVKDWPNPLPELDDDAKPHWELASQYQLFDLQLGTKIAPKTPNLEPKCHTKTRIPT